MLNNIDHFILYINNSTNKSELCTYRFLESQKDEYGFSIKISDDFQKYMIDKNDA